MATDWQINLTKIKDRNQYLLKSEKLADCRFLVGTSNQSLIIGHQLLLAMASPVFERMFFGSLPQNDDPILIPDVQPDAFEAMLGYIYTDEIVINSFDDACALYYVAKKYILPHVVKQCTNFLCYNLCPHNACRAYELGKFYEDQRLIESSMEHISINIQQVMADPSFMNIDFSTLLAILDQNRLNIDSELDLFNCLLILANEHGLFNENASDVVVEKTETESDVAAMMHILVDDDEHNGNNAPSSEEASTSSGTCGSVPNVAYKAMDTQRTKMDEVMLREAVKKIRFFTMTPKQFAEGPATSKLLKEKEAFAIVIKILSPTTVVCSMPEGFCLSRQKRGRSGIDQNNRYCISHCNMKTYDYNSKETAFSLTFKADRNIYLLGVQLVMRHSDQINIIRNFSASIKNMQKSVIAYTNMLEDKKNLITELTFRGPVFIYRDQNYDIEITNMHAYFIKLFSWDREIVSNGVKFRIIGVIPFYSHSGSPISGIVFTT